MLNWIVGIGRFEISHATSSLALFASCPRKCHLDCALRVFGYLKKYLNKRIVVYFMDPIVIVGDLSCYSKLGEDFMEG